MGTARDATNLHRRQGGTPACGFIALIGGSCPVRVGGLAMHDWENGSGNATLQTLRSSGLSRHGKWTGRRRGLFSAIVSVGSGSDPPFPKMGCSDGRIRPGSTFSLATWPQDRVQASADRTSE